MEMKAALAELIGTLYRSECRPGGPDRALKRDAPIHGVSVQVNMALLAALSPDSTARPQRARDLVQALHGAPVRSRLPPLAPVERPRRARLTVVAAALAVFAIAYGAWEWVRPGPAPPPSMSPRPDGDLLAIDRQIKAAAATGARDRWLAIAAEEPATLYGRARGEAERLKATAEEAHKSFAAGRYEDAERIWDRRAESFGKLLEEHHQAVGAARACALLWQVTLAAAPSPWLDDDATEASCSEAWRSARAGEEALRVGRFDAAAAAFLAAADAMARATALHREAVEALLAEAGRARDAGRYDRALSLIDEANPFASPDELLALHPGHPEGLALRAANAGGGTPPRDTMVNSLGQALKRIEPGRFLMGSPDTEVFRDRGEEPHAVRLTRTFWIATTEVTRSQFSAFVEETGYVTEAEREGWSHGLGADGRWRQVEGLTWRHPGFPQVEDHPVVCVSFDDALAFCRWLSTKEGRTCRLPTEAEWEYVCRADTGSARHWGEPTDAEAAWGNVADAAWVERFPGWIGFPWLDGYLFTSPVQSFPANPWGLFDMHGNVQEWCRDRYGAYESSAGGEVIDPVGPKAHSAEDRSPRVLRGGSFAAPPSSTRAARRDASPRRSRFVTVGFRVVMEEGD